MVNISIVLGLGIASNRQKIIGGTGTFQTKLLAPLGTTQEHTQLQEQPRAADIDDTEQPTECLEVGEVHCRIIARRLFLHT